MRTPNRGHSATPRQQRSANQKQTVNQQRASGSARHPRPEVDARIRQLDAERDPLSLPEEIVSEASKAGTNVGIPQQRDEPWTTNIADLQRTPVPELLAMADADGLTEYAGLSRQELIFQILKNRMKVNGLMYGEGTLEILPDGFGFLRSPEYHYLSCPDDIYVSPSQIRRFGLKTGSHVAGQIRPPKENERYFALLRIEAINHDSPGRDKAAVAFDDLTPLHPSERLRLECCDGPISMRIIDLVSPLGWGTRGLIVAPPQSGKTQLLQSIAQSISANHADAHVFMLLIDERPEEVTMIERELSGANCEVISSTIEEPPSRHIQVAQMVIEKARRIVEGGGNVVVLMDSITKLARAHNSDGETSGKLIAGALDAGAMQRPKAIFGSARKIEEGGSLTILATAEIRTGSDLDDTIFKEFRSCCNSEIVLAEELAQRRVWPAIDIFQSNTRREQSIIGDDDYEAVSNLRNTLDDYSPREAMKHLVKSLQPTSSNMQFLQTYTSS